MRFDHRGRHEFLSLLLLIAALSACAADDEPGLHQPPPPLRMDVPRQKLMLDDGMARMLIGQARSRFAALMPVANNPNNPVTDAKVNLGRQLYYETRLSKSQTLSCNSCHDLASYGVDVRQVGGKTSMGHAGAFGDRNSPTVYNAALHFSQFWDGRAADVEEQAKGPILNPVEMAMPSEAATVGVLKSIPGYQPLFEAAFPEDKKPISYDNMARAIGAFERKLITPSRFDAFLGGQLDALSMEEQRGLAVFMQAGCVTCHNGPALGGGMFQKLGLLKPYPTEDVGRAQATGKEEDKFFFKVPSLRNIEKTAPYLHDGSIATLEEMVKLMAEYQIPKGNLSEGETADVLAFLRALTGELPKAYIAPPPPLPAGPNTPAPKLD